MSEPIKKPSQIPDSYSPKKLEILNMMNETMKIPKNVIVTENGLYIDGVPPIEPKTECSFSRCMALLLKTIGANVSYEQAAGLEGSCFRASLYSGWDPGSNILNVSHGLGMMRNACQLYGMDINGMHDGCSTGDERGEVARNSIDEGVPVLVMGGRGPGEWGILLGYEKTHKGFEYFGRSYFDKNANENELFTVNHYVLMNMFPNGMDYMNNFNIPCKPKSATDALKNSLENCLAMYEPHESKGYGAYDKMLDSFNKNIFNGGNTRTILDTLTDARRAAYIYLAENATLLFGRNKEKLLAAAALYKNMFDILDNAKECDGFGMEKIKNSGEIRSRYIERLRICKELEYQTHSIIKEILDNWEA